MTIGEIANELKAKVLTRSGDLSCEVKFAFSSDLMSDVLTRDYEHTVLITGLSNLQAVRTAEMSDIESVIIARGKEVSRLLIDLAEESNIVLLRSDYSVYKISGLLYQAGIQPVF